MHVSRLWWFAALVVWVLGCGGGGGGTPRDAGAPEDAAPLEDASPRPDAAVGADARPGCDPTVRSFDVPDFTAPFVIQERTIEPTMVDSASNLYPAARHRLYLPTDSSVTLRDQLFVMLPGTGNLPQAFDHVCRIAARAGYPVIGLAYDSREAPQQTCIGVTSSVEDHIACRNAVIIEKVHGTDETDLIAVDEANSIDGRLLRLLRYIHDMMPAAGADRFFDASGIVWDDIVVAGFSQGAMMAAYLGREHALARNILMAGGCDFVPDPGGPIPMPWCLEARATPPQRTFGLMHVLDEPEEDTMTLDMLYGLTAFGGFADAATGSPDYCTGSHALQTDLRSAGGGMQYHLSVAHDPEMPVDSDGIPMLAEDYYYMMTAETR